MFIEFYTPEGQVREWVINYTRERLAELNKLNTLQRLDKMEAWDKERDLRQADRAKAIRTFYAQLNDAQKKAFDENAFPQHPHHGRPHHE